jgi:hypothetical protein
MITEADGGLHLVRLDGAPSALHLTRRGNLDAFGVDDRLSTGRLDDPGVHGDPLLATAQQLSDAVFDWWNGAPPSLVHRTRSTPSARTMAFELVRSSSRTSTGARRSARAPARRIRRQRSRPVVVRSPSSLSLSPSVEALLLPQIDPCITGRPAGHFAISPSRRGTRSPGRGGRR